MATAVLMARCALPHRPLPASSVVIVQVGSIGKLTEHAFHAALSLGDEVIAVTSMYASLEIASLRFLILREAGLMTVAIVRAPPDSAGSVPAANALMDGDLEVPGRCDCFSRRAGA